MRMRRADIDQILSSDVFAIVRQKIRRMGKNAGGRFAKSAPHLRRARNNPWPRRATFRCRDWFESLGGGQKLLIVRNSPARNLPLAARPDVGHIGRTGDVAEWLKAAVC